MPVASRIDLESLLEGELRDGRTDDPFRPAVLRWAMLTGRPADHDAVLGLLEAMATPGRGSRRFRWRLPVGSWMPLEQRVRWRPAEAELAERNANAHATRLWLPLVLVEHLAWLEELASGPDPVPAARARALLDEALPVTEDVVAATVAGGDAWGDTFLLWSFSRSPRALSRVRGLVLALAARYAARAGRSGGIVRGRSFPFFDQPMTSATAHLATASATLGEGIESLDEQLAWLQAERRPDGGWGDPRQPSDLLTTLAVTRLLGAIDPSFDPTSAVGPLRTMAEAAGARPMLIGPEWPWMAAELALLTAWADRPFTERFRWPNVPPSVMEPRFGVPRFEGYLALADLFKAVPALGRGDVDVAFIDLANFGNWNATHGQAAGDDLLALLTAQLRTLPQSRTYRDGGDEFLVVGAPGTGELEARLAGLFGQWPGVQGVALPGLPIVPLRAAIRREPADDLREARGRLGVDIGIVKGMHRHPPPKGVIERFPR